jgi:hypothetical protein
VVPGTYGINGVWKTAEMVLNVSCPYAEGTVIVTGKKRPNKATPLIVRTPFETDQCPQSEPA